MNEVHAASNDARMLARIARRDREAFREFYDRYATALFSIIVRVLKDRREAGKVLEEVFAQIWREAETYDARVSTPFTWALTITRKKAIHPLRAQNRRYTFVHEDIGRSSATNPLAPEELFGEESAAVIRSAMEILPLEQRQAIEMAFLGGMTHYEISEALDQPLGIIKARVRRGLLSLRESLKEPV